MSEYAEDQKSQVIVVGAGPTGLLLAGDLAEAGVDVTVLEKRGAELSNLSRAFAVHARTLEVLDARGLADELFAKGGNKVERLGLFGRAQVNMSGLDSRFPYLLMTPQYQVEEVLRDRALRAGAAILYGREVTGIDQRDGIVTVHTDEGERTAAYVVGTDGVHSAVRRAIDVPFPGEAVLKSIMLADVKLDRPPKRSPAIDAGDGAFCFVADFADGYWRIIAWNRRDQQPDDAPVEMEELKEALRFSFGDDFGMRDARWVSRFHSDERQAPTYRKGNVFIAGDAAHCHSPAGGMGMNTGLQDAANLSWKLAAVLRGADPSLLDTFEGERHPVGEAVLRTSGAMVRAAAGRSRVGRLLRTVALSTVVRLGPVMAKMAGQISGIAIHYGHGVGEHREVGRRARDTDLVGGKRLYERLRGGRFVVLDSAGEFDGEHVVDEAPTESDGLARVIRPDGYIGWAGTDDPEAIRGYLAAHAGK
ncbi:FAD-dependent monooxygenase [Glycomyces buryatensis]|uniref:FAD-dependent oxidoreductase n=1 Tax=Glycomyces buryatensis TaxID=2570927 RepID=A0A4S8QK24_9ACTN|nr:FAD-dependent monooxygenase [Glycomyces buryatensis]THV41769.1 FAD-dependent oxidoreductase [Glycomyces buryatensis]